MTIRKNTHTTPPPPNAVDGGKVVLAVEMCSRTIMNSVSDETTDRFCCSLLAHRRSIFSACQEMGKGWVPRSTPPPPRLLPPPPLSLSLCSPVPLLTNLCLSSLLYVLDKKNTAMCARLPKVACDRLRREFNIQVQTGRAYVAYREGISEEAEM